MKRKKRSLKCHRRTASPYPFLHCIRFFFAQGLAKSRTVRSGTHTSGLLPGPRRRLIAALVKKDFIRACIQHGVRTSGLYSAGLSYQDCTRRDCRIGIVHGGIVVSGSYTAVVVPEMSILCGEIAFVRSYYGFTRRRVVLLIIVSQRIRYVIRNRLRADGLRSTTFLLGYHQVLR